MNPLVICDVASIIVPSLLHFFGICSLDNCRSTSYQSSKVLKTDRLTGQDHKPTSVSYVYILNSVYYGDTIKYCSIVHTRQHYLVKIKVP